MANVVFALAYIVVLGECTLTLIQGEATMDYAATRRQTLRQRALEDVFGIVFNVVGLAAFTLALSFVGWAIANS